MPNIAWRRENIPSSNGDNRDIGLVDFGFFDSNELCKRLFHLLPTSSPERQFLGTQSVSRPKKQRSKDDEILDRRHVAYGLPSLQRPVCAIESYVALPDSRIQLDLRILVTVGHIGDNRLVE